MTIKDEALQLIGHLPADCSWEDVSFAIHVRLTIEAGLADGDADRVVSTEQVRERLRLGH
ncbi:MAG TPA: hypothetical protein VFH27_08520 [Longimicrobiaceae bacterium]|nr:hypothetical protein [Longimicrobiaceae bacterium]